MDRLEKEAPKGGLTKERFLADVRPLLDEALRQRVGVLSAEISVVNGNQEGNEGFVADYPEEGATGLSYLEVTSALLHTEKYDPEIGDRNITSVYEGWLNGATPRFLIEGTGFKRKVVEKVEWQMVLGKAKAALDVAILNHSKMRDGQGGKGAEEEAREDQHFIQEYDRIFQEMSEEALNYSSVLYPGAEYAVVTSFDNSGAWFDLQNFYQQGRDNGTQKPTTRLLIVSDPKRDIEATIAIYESPFEIKWFKHKEKQSETPLSSEEKEWVISTVKEILQSSRQV